VRYALVGYGRMGREIEAVASRRGHRLVAVVDPAVSHPLSVPSFRSEAVRRAEVAFEFTAPQAAERNVVALLRAGIRVVCGTTGWSGASPAVRRACRGSGSGAVLAPNFSVGMNLFYRLVAEAARLYGPTGSYDPYVFERHHRAKRDCPSGTALEIARRLSEALGGRKTIVAGRLEGALPAGALHVAGVRAGSEPGLHAVGFDGEHDAVCLEHRARGRTGFALGAVLAAEWIRRRKGIHSFDEVLDDLLRKGGNR